MTFCILDSEFYNGTTRDSLVFSEPGNQARSHAMKRLVFLAIVLLSILPARLAGADRPARWIVVTAPAFRAAIEPLCKRRASEGFDVVVVQTADVGAADKLRRHVAGLCRQHQGKSYVLLVGEVDKAGEEDPAKTVVPCLRGTVSRMQGQPTDNGYGCLGEGLLPTVAVGRLPARTESELRTMIDKLDAFERVPPHGLWKKHLTMLVGHPGGSSPAEKALAEQFIETTCVARGDQLHPSWQPRAIFHLPRSRFGVPDTALHDQTLAYLRMGQAFTVFAGHSSAAGFWSNGAPFLDRGDWQTMNLGAKAGILVSCGCYGCQLRGSDGEGYGQAAIRNPRGPVAVIGAHGESYAAMGQLALDGLIKCLAQEELPERLGDVWLSVKGGLDSGKMDGLTFRLLDQADGSRGKIPLEVQRREHLEMWMLLGDPATRLPALPQTIRLAVKSPATPGSTLTIDGRMPATMPSAQVRITLERSFTSVPDGLAPLPADPLEKAKVMLANHERAHRVVLAQIEQQASDGLFQAALLVPAGSAGKRLIVRAYASAGRAESLGVLALQVEGTDK
jgi:hypothetical protein